MEAGNHVNCRAGLEYDPPPPTDSHLLSQLQTQVHRCLPQNPLHFRPLREWNMFLHQLPQGWGVPGHGLSTSRSPGQTYETDLPQVKSARFPGRPLVAPGQSHAHRAPPTDIEAPPCSAYVPTLEMLGLLRADPPGSGILTTSGENQAVAAGP